MSHRRGGGRRLSPWLAARPKLRLDEAIAWEHHRGGWKHVVALVGEHLACPDGVRFLSSVEDVIFRGEVVNEPWVGFIHQVPRQHYNFPDLGQLLLMDGWKASIRNCLGLWTLSSYVKDWLLAAGCPVPVARIFYPCGDPGLPFDLARFTAGKRRRVLHVGEFLRRYESFYELTPPPGYDKVLLRGRGFDPDAEALTSRSGVRVVEGVDDAEYDRLLAESVLFLDLLDAPANTTIVEAMARATPLLVNRVGGVAEYLGEDYPLYFETLEEATRKLADDELLAAAVDYLETCPQRAELADEAFLRAMQNSAIYRALPVPPSQAKPPFRRCDVTVVVCAYQRVADLPEQLERFARQRFDGQFEILLWNNNPEVREQVDRAVAAFSDRLDLTVIHSSQNFYCIIRLAVVPLMRSELLVVCDDDVLPEEDYLATFVRAWQAYGPDAAICARGHIFRPHELDGERPERVWAEGEHLVFCDERVPDTPVHFLHADNCLIPRHLLQLALQYEMERPEFVLVDDYWLSFILSHCLGVLIWKIQAAHAFTFTAAAEDPEVALFLSDPVREQRVDFYVYHMLHGWPFPRAEPDAEPDEAAGDEAADDEAAADEAPADEAAGDEAAGDGAVP